MRIVLSHALGLAAFVAFERFGSALAGWAGLPVPGGIVGFALLFLALFLWRELPQPAVGMSSVLMSHLTLFLVPSVVAAVVAFRFREVDAVFLIGCAVAVTLFSALACGLVMRWIERREAGASDA